MGFMKKYLNSNRGMKYDSFVKVLENTGLKQVLNITCETSRKSKRPASAEESGHGEHFHNETNPLGLHSHLEDGKLGGAHTHTPSNLMGVHTHNNSKEYTMIMTDGKHSHHQPEVICDGAHGHVKENFG